jgi:GNAT superfamily N-acetyltransferase
MDFSWIRENPPIWDEDKRRIILGAREGVFDETYGHLSTGAIVPGEWWRVESEGRTVGYGWLDSVFGNAEVLLATDPECRKQGVGSFIVEHLNAEAGQRGLNYIYNVVQKTHPAPDELRRWLEARGFVGKEGGRLLKRATHPPAEDATADRG